MATTRVCLLLSVLLPAALCQGDSHQSECLKAARASRSDKCQTPDISNLKFSLSSHRNQTGHWVAQVKLEHGGEQGHTGSDHSETGLWHVDLEQTSTQCDGSHSVQTVASITAPPPGPPLGYHPPEYELFPGVGYYKFHTTPKTWDEARRICQQEGGYLVVINSEAESKVMQNFLDGARNIKGANHNDYAFVGFHDRFVEGEYLTVFGKPLSSTGFARWASLQQPDNAGGNENCGSIHRNGGLNDIPCPWKLPFFCEHKTW